MKSIVAGSGSPIIYRLATIENADRILVVEGGTVMQRGTGEQLLAEEGTYWKFVGIRSEAEGWRFESWRADEVAMLRRELKQGWSERTGEAPAAQRSVACRAVRRRRQ